MAKNVQVVFTDDEAKFLMSALDRVPVQGLAAARLVTAISEKLAGASRFAYEKPPTPSRAGLDQALMSRVTLIERAQVPKEAEIQPTNNGKPAEEAKP